MQKDEPGSSSYPTGPRTVSFASEPAKLFVWQHFWLDLHASLPSEKNDHMLWLLAQDQCYGQWSISSTFYVCFFCQYPWPKKLRRQNVTEKSCAKHFPTKNAHLKCWSNRAQGVNLTNMCVRNNFCAWKQSAAQFLFHKHLWCTTSSP